MFCIALITKFLEFNAKGVNLSDAFKIVYFAFLDYLPALVASMWNSCLCFFQELQSVVFAHNFPLTRGCVYQSRFKSFVIIISRTIISTTKTLSHQEFPFCLHCTMMDPR